LGTKPSLKQNDFATMESSKRSIDASAASSTPRKKIKTSDSQQQHHADARLLRQGKNMILHLLLHHHVKQSAVPEMLGMLKDHLCDDRDVVNCAVRLDVRSLLFASPRLRGDRRILLEAMRVHGSASTCLRYAGPEAFADPKILEAVVHEFAHDHRRAMPMLRRFSDELLGDKERNLAVAAAHGYVLSPRHFGNDRQVALAAVRGNTLYWHHLSEEMKKDGDVAMEAVYNVWTLKDLPRELKGNRNVVLRAIEAYDRRRIEEESSGEEWIKTRKSLPPDWFAAASKTLRSDPEILLAAVKKNGLFLKDAILRGGSRDAEIVKAALDNDVCAFPFVPLPLKRDVHIIAEAIKATDKITEDEWYGWEEPSYDEDYHVGRSGLPLDYIRDNLDAWVLGKLAAVRAGISRSAILRQTEPEDLVHTWASGSIRDQWEKVWLLSQNMEPQVIPRGVMNSILLFAGVFPDFRFTKAIHETGPILDALGGIGESVGSFLGNYKHVNNTRGRQQTLFDFGFTRHIEPWKSDETSELISSVGTAKDTTVR
jgi:hypothetical protein